MPLYEKLGLDPQLFTRKYFHDIQESILTSLNVKPPHPDLISTYKRSLIFDSSRMCLGYFMIDEKSRIEHYAKPMLDYALEYFFGDWRDIVPIDGKIGRVYWKKTLWIDDFRNCMLWGSVIGEWDKIKEISKYPDELCLEADIDTQEKKAWYILLAIYLRENSLDNAGRYIGIIENGKKKREKLLLNVLRTILAGDAEAFQKEFKTYLKHYKAREFPQRLIPEKLAIDGTILFNIAKHNGMDVKFPEEYIDHYIYL